MTETTVSPKFQVVIPREVRAQIPVRPGQQVSVVAKNGVIYVIPAVSLKSLKGTLPKLPLKGFRDKKDRL